MDIDADEMADGACANPLLLGWLKQWYDEALDKNMKGASAVYVVMAV